MRLLVVVVILIFHQKGAYGGREHTDDETDGHPQSPKSKNSSTSLPELERVSPDKSAKTLKVGERVNTFKEG